MKKSVYQHCTNCQVCAKHTIKTQQLKNEHFSSPPQPMEFIAMDLIGEFHPASSKGNRFALTAVCMLMGFTFCIPLKSKRAEDIIKAYICCDIGQFRIGKNRCQDDIFPRIELFPLSSLSSDNTNCKNDIQLFRQLFDELSVYRDYH